MGQSGHEGDRERLKGVAGQGAASMVQHYGSSIRNDTCQHKNVRGHMLEAIMAIDLLLGLFRGAVFHCGGLPKNSPLKISLTWLFPFLNDHFPPLMGHFPEYLDGPFPSQKSPAKQRIKKRPIKSQ